MSGHRQAKQHLQQIDKLFKGDRLVLETADGDSYDRTVQYPEEDFDRNDAMQFGDPDHDEPLVIFREDAVLAPPERADEEDAQKQIVDVVVKA